MADNLTGGPMSDQDEIECTDCAGHGWRAERNLALGPGLHELTCPVCNGRGWRMMTDDEQEAAWQRQQEDAMSEPPITMDEQHRAAWAQKQALRR